MASDLSDFKLEAFRALRVEVEHHIQAMGAVQGVALTATGAIGAFGLSKTGNRDALLVLPFVLSGLGLIQVDHGIQIRRLGEYIRTYLWPSPRGTGAHKAVYEQPWPSWEEWIANMRLVRSVNNPAKLTGFMGNAVVFTVPSVGALAITASAAWGTISLAIAWGLGAVLLAVSLVMTDAVQRRELAPSDWYPHLRTRPQKPPLAPAEEDRRWEATVQGHLTEALGAVPPGADHAKLAAAIAEVVARTQSS